MKKKTPGKKGNVVSLVKSMDAAAALKTRIEGSLQSSLQIKAVMKSKFLLIFIEEYLPEMLSALNKESPEWLEFCTTGGMDPVISTKILFADQMIKAAQRKFNLFGGVDEDIYERNEYFFDEWKKRQDDAWRFP